MVDLYKTDPIILFDGVCNLCNGFVKMLIKADKKAVLKFLPLQSPYLFLAIRVLWNRQLFWKSFVNWDSPGDCCLLPVFCPKGFLM